MNTVLITSVGSTTAISAAKALRKAGGYHIIGTDINLASEIPGTIFCDTVYQVPMFSDARYIERVIAICKREQVKFLIPIVDQEVEMIAQNSDQFQQAGVTVIGSPHHVVASCNDKYLTWKTLHDKGIETPRVYLPAETDLPEFPLFIKPRRGVSSRDCYVVSMREDLDFFLKRVDEPVIQQYLEGKQLVIDIVNDSTGRNIAAVPRHEIMAKSGLGVKAVTVKDDEAVAYAVRIAEAIGITGLCNIEVFRNGSNINLIEVNPRLSAGSILSTAAGVNIPDIAIKSFAGQTADIAQYKEGIYVTRYWEEVYFDHEKLMEF